MENKYTDLKPTYGFTVEELEEMLVNLEYDPLEIVDGIYEHPNGRIERPIGVLQDTGETILDHIKSRGRVIAEPTLWTRKNMGPLILTVYLLTVDRNRLWDIVNKLVLDNENMKNAMFNNLTNNVFSANFNVLDADIEIIEGYYDEVRKEVIC